MELHVGNSVVVKSGVVDPDLGIEIGGWQGRIEEVDEGGTLLIRWDSITLRDMGLDITIRCENENLDWELMTLEVIDIEESVARDTDADVWRVAQQLKADMAGHLRL
ncbi:MAG: hypothetical protein V1792_03165 [Pseudomonadota bacterium]